MFGFIKNAYHATKERVSSIVDNATGLVVGTVGTGLAVVGNAAHAVADTTAIDAAKTDLLAYAAALLVLGVAVWGAMKVARMFGSK